MMCRPTLLLWWVLVERVGSFCPSSGITKPPPLRHDVLHSSPSLLVTPQHDRSSSNKCPMTRLSAFSLSSSDVENEAQPLSTRSKLRQISGLILILNPNRISSHDPRHYGISLSGVISNTIRRILGVFRPRVRWILQPLLIAYYVPISVVRYYYLRRPFSTTTSCRR